MVHQMSFYPLCPMQGRPDLLCEAALSDLDQDDLYPEMIGVDDAWPLAPIGCQRLAPSDRVIPSQRMNWPVTVHRLAPNWDFVPNQEPVTREGGER
jgi:hypothetical protein